MTALKHTPKSSVAMTLAGYDPSSGAGITADLAVFSAHALYGTSAITVWTVQSTLGVAGTEIIRPELFEATVQHLVQDIFPAGIKLGALGSREIAQKLFFLLEAFSEIPVIFDPVLSSSSGKALFREEDIDALHALVLPRVNWLTPNWRELELLTNLRTNSSAEVELALAALGKKHPHLHIVATGGDQEAPRDCLRLPSGEMHWLAGEHIATTSTHGTGCAFSSALLSNLIHGDAPLEATRRAKHYVTEAIRTAPKIGHGRGPLNLLWPLQASTEDRSQRR